ncbi:MAG: hypothetical protein COB67_10465 [SAR324 cluster bacterium]|uniref:Uncharacterized protein n=1 Tax=SAR324 cluster bacterium TaxID=2024889 RepID=A0A2A4SY59_9DELT|nr:MAG: hypothetical protein COB67_10465 [SAR324 cluster bacterium]
MSKYQKYNLQGIPIHTLETKPRLFIPIVLFNIFALIGLYALYDFKDGPTLFLVGAFLGAQFSMMEHARLLKVMPSLFSRIQMILTTSFVFSSISLIVYNVFLYMNNIYYREEVFGNLSTTGYWLIMFSIPVISLMFLTLFYTIVLKKVLSIKENSLSKQSALKGFKTSQNRIYIFNFLFFYFIFKETFTVFYEGIFKIDEGPYFFNLLIIVIALRLAILFGSEQTQAIPNNKEAFKLFKIISLILVVFAAHKESHQLLELLANPQNIWIHGYYQMHQPLWIVTLMFLGMLFSYLFLVRFKDMVMSPLSFTPCKSFSKETWELLNYVTTFLSITYLFNMVYFFILFYFGPFFSTLYDILVSSQWISHISNFMLAFILVQSKILPVKITKSLGYVLISIIIFYVVFNIHQSGLPLVIEMEKPFPDDGSFLPVIKK